MTKTGNLSPVIRTALVFVVIVASTAGTLRAFGAWRAKTPLPYHSPFDLAFSPDGKTLAVSDRTAGLLAFIDVATGKVSHAIALNDEPTGVVWSADGAKVFVSEYAKNAVAEIDVAKEKIARRFDVGARPMGLALAPKRQLLLVANSATHNVSALALAEGKERARIAVAREPFFVAVTPDESLAVVGNLLPACAATDPQVASAVSLIDLDKLTRVTDIRLPVGSTTLRGAAISPDGRWAYVVHTLGHFNLPATQLERGWINTNALSIIDLGARQVYATFLLDYISEGGADPWGVVLSKDGQTLWATLAGVHQIARLNLGEIHTLLAGEKISRELPEQGGTSVWHEIRKDPKKRDLLAYDLAALYAADLIKRSPIPGNGPRGVALSPNGKQLATAAYYSGEVLLADPETAKITATVPLGPARKADPVRRGEAIFHDATYCFQHWLSCATCHPEGRADGLNWDLLNDGIGNPKNTKSLLLSHRTPPAMSLGVRANMEVAAVAGFRFILFHEPETAEVQAVQAYLRSMQPERSPYLLAGGKLSPKAKRGKAIFESSKTKCASCHSGALFTDLQMYDVGTASEPDKGKKFDTPTLIELWRTAPYLSTGEGATLQEVLTKFNKGDQHGVTSRLSPNDLDALVEYLLSL